MAMASLQIDPDDSLPPEYEGLPLRALRLTARTKIGQYLDLEGTVSVCVDDEGQEIDVTTNFNGLAELAGFSYQDTMKLDRYHNPTKELLDKWTSRNEYTHNAKVGYLWKYLRLMGRKDVLMDCRRVILADCKYFIEVERRNADAEGYELEQTPLQDSTVDSDERIEIDENDILTVQDVEPALAGDTTRIQFDAYLCFSIEDPVDRQFARYMIERIEIKEGLKLFVPGRDDLPGGAQNTINAFIIEKRCKRVLILLSRAFLKSPVCDFQLKFAQCLEPGAKHKKLIPVIREEGIPMPPELKILKTCDFTKADMVDWVWNSLISALRAPMGSVVKDSSFELERSLKEVRFPAQQCRLRGDSDTVSCSSR